MKKLLLIFTLTLIVGLSACGQTTSSSDTTDSPSDIAVSSSDYAFDSIKNDSDYTPTPDIQPEYSDEWYQGKYYSDVENSNHWINFSEAIDGLNVSVPGYSFRVGQPEIIKSDEYGTVLRYCYSEKNGRFDFLIDYMVESDTIIVLYTNYTYQSSNAVDYSGVYTYDYELTYKRFSLQSRNDGEVLPDSDNSFEPSPIPTIQTEIHNGFGQNTMDFEEQDDEEETLPDSDGYVSYIPPNDYFFDGQRFECFDTESGEDIILTVRLFYTADDQLFYYKGELSNGVEFWFDWYSYDFTTNETQFKIDCADNSNAYLVISPNVFGIQLLAEKGEEYGNMYAYSGTYIGLPDTSE